MSRIPRLLPLVGIAIGGVLAVKALTEAPQLYLATQALAEDVVRPGAPAPALPPNASILATNFASTGASGASHAPPAACAPTAAELAKEAGLSPAELQVLQSLGDRRGQLDQREESLDTQVQLIAAAEAKLDARIQQMNGLKSDIQGLLGQASAQQQADADRLVRIYEDMDPKKAAAALTLMDDSVRLPIAAKMKERKLADILGKMDPADAKALTEKLAQRMAGSPVLAAAKAALNPNAPPPPAAAATTPAANAAAAAPSKGQNAQVGQTATTPTTTADASKTAPAPKTAPAKHRVARAKVRPKAAPSATAKATPPAQPAAPAQAQAKATPAPVKAAVPPAKTAVAPTASPIAKSG